MAAPRNPLRYLLKQRPGQLDATDLVRVGPVGVGLWQRSEGGARIRYQPPQLLPPLRIV